MTRLPTIYSVLLFSVIGFCAADERTAPRLLPATTIAYIELPNPPELLTTILDHPLRERIAELEPYQQAMQSQQYRNFLTGRKFLEIQLGMEWRAALETLTAQGIYFGLDAETNGVAVLVRGRDSQSMDQFRAKLLELTKLGGNPDAVREAEYRGITAYEANQAKFAVIDEWLVVTNKGDLGKSLIDAMLDGRAASLADSETFQSAAANRQRAATAWGFVDVRAIRDAGVADKVFQGRADNPGAEVLLGGLLTTLTRTPYVTSSLTLNREGFRLGFQAPHSQEWVPEERNYFFGSNGAGKGPILPTTKDTLFSLSTYRDMSDMWLRAGDLFDERINDGFANADNVLTTLFSGKDFGEDILGSLTPRIGFVATLQDFTDQLPRPAIKLPSFALVLELHDPDTMSDELRRTFQTLIGFLNVTGAQEGREQLDQSVEVLENGAKLITSYYIPEIDERESTRAEILFNFSPTVGFSGKRFIVSSTTQLARELVQATVPEGESTNTNASLDAAVLKKALQKNRNQLISQNMLEEGNSREEAETQIDLLLQIIDYFRDSSLKLDFTRDHAELEFQIRLANQS